MIRQKISKRGADLSIPPGTEYGYAHSAILLPIADLSPYLN